MNYQVFNPLTGQYVKCDTKEEARATLALLIQDFYTKNTPPIYEKLTNEKGDYAWVSSKFDTGLYIKYE